MHFGCKTKNLIGFVDKFLFLLAILGNKDRAYECEWDGNRHGDWDENRVGNSDENKGGHRDGHRVGNKVRNRAGYKDVHWYGNRGPAFFIC